MDTIFKKSLTWAGLILAIGTLMFLLHQVSVFSQRISLIESPQNIHVQLPGQAAYETYDLYDTQLKKKLLGTKDLWRYYYEFDLPENTNTFLISQFMNGGSIFVNGTKVSELPRSSESHKYIWFRPHLVYAPEHILTAGQSNKVRIESASYLRYIYVMPVYAGNTLDVHVLSDILFFISRTLSVASSIVSLVAGGLLLATWSINKSDRIFLYAGLSAVTWALLYLLLNFPSIPSETIKFFRFMMYALIGVSMYNLMMYLTQLALNRVSTIYQRTILTVSATGPCVYILSAGEFQNFVDKIWIAGMIIVSFPALYHFFKHLQYKGIHSNRSLGLVLFLGFLAAYRDSEFIGFEQIISHTRQTTTWDLIDSPILISYIVVPMIFIFSSGRLLNNYRTSLQTILEHNTTLEIELQKRELQLKIAHLEDIRKKQRDITEITRSAIHRDLHDGIGSRLVATTYALRSGKLTRKKLEESLVNCLRDIKSIMESESEQEVRSLQSLLFEYCSDMEEILADTGVKLTYSIPEDREFSLIGNRSNEILKMIQELLSNALKHSCACQIHVDMQISDSYLTITLSEKAYDPVKMPLYQMSERINTSSNTGLKSLELRAQSIGAAFIQKVDPNSRTSFIAIRMFVDRFLYLSDRYPDGKDDRRLFLNSQISDLT